MANSDKQLTAKQVATAVLEKVGELLRKSELLKAGGDEYVHAPHEHEHENLVQVTGGKGTGVHPAHEIKGSFRGPEWKQRNLSAQAYSSPEEAKAAHKQKLGEMKRMPSPNLPKSEDMEKAEGYKPQNSEKENAKPSEHNSKDAMQHADGPGPKGEIHPKEKEAGDPTNESRPTPAPGNNPKEKAEGNNELAGTTPTQVGQDGKNKPGYDEMKGHLKLAKFIGRMEHKRSTKDITGAQAQSESTAQHKEVVGSK